MSGFVVFLPTAVRGRFGNPWRYAIRRAARLLPAYYLILVLAVLATAGGYPPAETLFLHSIGFQTLAPYFGLGPPGFYVIGPVWTLTVEISFYIVLPFIAMAFYRHPRIGLLIGAIIAVTWTQFELHLAGVADLFGIHLSQAFVDRSNAAIGIQLPFWAFSFALGMIGARIFAAIHATPAVDQLHRRARWVQLAGLVGLAVFSVSAFITTKGAAGSTAADHLRFSPLFMVGYSACLAGFMVSTALLPGVGQKIFGNRWVRWLAEISYGAYLAHALIVFVILWRVGIGLERQRDEYVVLATAALLGSVLYGYLSARFLEQPIRRWARRFGGRRN